MKIIDLEWVSIPAGQALIKNKQNLDMFPVCENNVFISIYLPEFQISKYPITNAQYLQFLSATGHKRPNSPLFAQFDSGKEDLANHPAAWLSWFDAIAFCQWVGGRLPTGSEWEKAASGVSGFMYPWGHQWENGCCNSLEAENSITTPVDRYPQGASMYGVYDMVGNVWEWTDEWIVTDKTMRKSGVGETIAWDSLECFHQIPVLRGGSLISDRFCSNAVFRYIKYHAHEYGDWVGFRPVKL